MRRKGADGLVVFSLLAGFLVACQRDERAAGGSPVMVSVEVVDPEGTVLALDAGAGPVTVSPLVQFVATFDRLLDATLLEELIDGKPVGRMGVARLEGVGMPRAEISYQPNGDIRFGLIFPAGPRLVVQPAPTLPSGAAVTLTFEEASLRGKDGSAFTRGPGVPQTLSVTTLPFTARIRAAPMMPGGSPAADPGVPTDAGAPERLAPATPILVEFSNIPHAEASGHITVTAADAAGAVLPELDATVQADPSAPTGFVLTPPGGGWPAGGSLSVEVTPGAKDALGVPLASSTSAQFEVTP